MQTHFLECVIFVLFHALDRLCSASCGQGALQEAQDSWFPCRMSAPPSWLLPAPTPHIRACNFELENLRCKHAGSVAAGEDQKESDPSSPPPPSRNRAVGQPWGQWASLAPTPRGEAEKKAFIVKKNSFQKEQWDLGELGYGE